MASLDLLALLKASPLSSYFGLSVKHPQDLSEACRTEGLSGMAKDMRGEVHEKSLYTKTYKNIYNRIDESTDDTR